MTLNKNTPCKKNKLNAILGERSVDPASSKLSSVDNEQSPAMGLEEKMAHLVSMFRVVVVDFIDGSARIEFSPHISLSPAHPVVGLPDVHPLLQFFISLKRNGN